jgi:hypothetical protein
MHPKYWLGNIKGRDLVIDEKGKVVPMLLLNEHHAMKAYWGVEG